MRFWDRSKEEFDAEIEAHLAMAAQDKQATGADARSARQSAMREFGNVALIKDVTHELMGRLWLERLHQDIRFAMRQIRRTPGLSLAVILTLALGVGVNSAVFSVVNGFMIRPLPYPDADRVASLILHQEGVSQRTGNFGAEDEDSHTSETWTLISRQVTAVQAAAQGGTTGVNLQAGSGPGTVIRYVRATRVSAAYFKVLGIQLLLGRGFSAEEDRPGGPKAVVLSYDLWQSAFRGSAGVLGKQVTLKGEPHTVIGVLPRDARTPGQGELFTSLVPSDANGECGGDNCSILLRLRNGANWEQAAAQVAHLRSPIFDEIARTPRGRAWFYVQPLSKYLSSQMRTPVLALMLAVSFIMLIACANLAGLTLVKIDRRTAEIATRLALGAPRAAIIRQVWMESLLLTCMGALSGWLVAGGVLHVFTKLVPSSYLPVAGFRMDGRVLGFTLGVSVLASLLFGALPALRSRSSDIRDAVARRNVRAGASSSRIRQMLIAGEVALTVLLLFSAGLLIRTLVYLETLPPGFDPHNVMTAKLSLDDARYRDPAAFRLLLDRSLQAMRRIPGVESAAAGLSVPYERGLNQGLRIIDGPLAGRQPSSSLAWVSPEYFRTLRIPILSGRSLADSDTPSSERVAVVNASFGRQFFHTPDPVGRHVATGQENITIVGVAGDVAKKPGIYPDAPLSTEPVIYIAAAQADPRLVALGNIWFQPSWIVRTRGPLSSIAAAMQRALAEADPALPFAGFYAMSDVLAESLQYQRIEVALLSVLAGLALLLAAIGIFGLVANLVVQRTREIGIRIALGSTIHEAMMQVGASGLTATVLGMGGGLVTSLLSAQWLRSQLYGVRDHDPLTLAGVLMLLALIALAASLLPTLRISRIDPAETLRRE